MFTQESEWQAAYEAAETVLNTAIASGDLAIESGRPWNATLVKIARSVATAVIRSGGEQPEGDISDTIPIESEAASDNYWLQANNVPIPAHDDHSYLY